MEVIKIEKKICDEFVIKKHYSHRHPIFWSGFGLVINNKIEGVCVYGQPSPQIQKHAFIDRDFKLYELSRLVIQTNKKNAASFLIANSLKRLDKPSAIVSYADSEFGHCGIVYQSTNWIYTGSTKSHDSMYLIDGKRVHPMTLRDKGITNPKKWAKENNIKNIKPMEKHRYFYFVGSKKQKNKMISKLKYKINKNFPKTDKTKYYDGERINIEANVVFQQELF